VIINPHRVGLGSGEHRDEVPDVQMALSEGPVVLWNPNEGQLSEHVLQIPVGLEFARFCRFDQTIGHRAGVGSAGGAAETAVFPPKKGPDCVLHQVRVGSQIRAVRVTRELLPLIQ
jgi:hypothetical protein